MERNPLTYQCKTSVNVFYRINQLPVDPNLDPVRAVQEREFMIGSIGKFIHFLLSYVVVHLMLKERILRLVGNIMGKRSECSDGGGFMQIAG